MSFNERNKRHYGTFVMHLKRVFVCSGGETEGMDKAVDFLGCLNVCQDYWTASVHALVPLYRPQSHSARGLSLKPSFSGRTRPTFFTPFPPTHFTISAKTPEIICRDEKGGRAGFSLVPEIIEIKANLRRKLPAVILATREAGDNRRYNSIACSHRCHWWLALAIYHNQISAIMKCLSW